MEFTGRFTGRRAIVTGGGSGIGRAVALRLAAEGAKVAIWDRDAAAAGAVAGETGGIAVPLDVTDWPSVEAAAQRTVAELGGIDALVCSAGITGPTVPVVDFPVEGFRDVFAVNVLGVFHCNKAVVPAMIEAGYGRIVNIASIAGKEGNPNASGLLGLEGRRDRLHQVARQGARRQRRHRQRGHPGRRPHADLRPDAAEPHRLHALEDPDGAVRERRRDRGARLLGSERGMQLHHRLGLRRLRRSRDLLIGALKPAGRGVNLGGARRDSAEEAMKDLNDVDPVALLRENAAQPFEQARAMPPEVYTSEAFLAVELESIFSKEWLCVGRASALAEPGDYAAWEIAGQPVVVIRDRDGTLRALSNVCLHRMSTLLHGRGRTRAIVCPYHAWTYNLDGTLRGAPAMGKNDGFRPQGLLPAAPALRGVARLGLRDAQP